MAKGRFEGEKVDPAVEAVNLEEHGGCLSQGLLWLCPVLHGAHGVTHCVCAMCGDPQESHGSMCTRASEFRVKSMTPETAG